MAALNVKINDIEFKNPILTASGTFGYGLEFADLVSLDQLGGIIVKGTTLHPRQGNIRTRNVEFDGRNLVQGIDTGGTLGIIIG